MELEGEPGLMSIRYILQGYCEYKGPQSRTFEREGGCHDRRGLSVDVSDPDAHVTRAA